MPVHNFSPIEGRLERFAFSSARLENQLGDPILREVMVHIPPGVTGSVPCVIYLAPYTGTGMTRANWRAFSETLPQRHERLIREGKMKPMILVMPDTFTSLGGNQFVDSNVLGNWGMWLSNDLRNELKNRYDVSSFGLVGKSSGGYGAIVRGMLDDCWRAVACHSGDMGFGAMFRSELLSTNTRMQKHGSIAGFLEYIKDCRSLSGDDFHDLMMVGMAASYDAENWQTLPIDSHSGIIDEQAFQRWKKSDPLEMIEQHQNLPALWLDCGNSDQYHIQYGMRRFCGRLQELGIEHEWEEFDGTHSGIDHRMDLSLPWLSSILE